MCDPISLATTAAIMAGVGTGVSAIATYQQGQTAKGAANYNATVQRNAAKDSLQRGADAAAQKREETRRLVSSQNAAMAANGLVASTGTGLDLMTQTAGMGELDSLRITNNAAREAYGYRAQADITEYQGNQAGIAGALGAATTVLGGASNAYFGYKAATK